MERRFQYYVPFTNHTQYRARAKAREHNNTMEKFILNLRIFFMSIITSDVRTHIYIEDMRTKKALSVWIPLVSVFCSSGAVSGIRGKQMTPAGASDEVMQQISAYCAVLLMYCFMYSIMYNIMYCTMLCIIYYAVYNIM